MQPYTIDPLLDEESGPRRKWKQRLVVGLVCLVMLLLVGWWGVNSEIFFRKVILPKANEALGAEITIESSDWSLRHSLTLSVKLGTPRFDSAAIMAITISSSIRVMPLSLTRIN